jgi:hypothetical protein
MRYWVMAAAGVCLLGMSATAGNAATASGATKAEAPIVLAQNAPKDETVTQKVKRKVKRAWRNMTGYKFDVACPAVIPFTHKICTETGKSRDDARGKCIAANPLCAVSDVK